jgi:hypothetical protein
MPETLAQSSVIQLTPEDIRTELKQFITYEVARQLKIELQPINAGIEILEDGVDKIRHWKLGLWSNGSGGPPGWLENFAADTTKQFAEIKEIVTSYVKDQTVRDTKERLEEQLSINRQRSWTLGLGMGMFGLSILTLLSAIAKDLHFW